MENIYEDSTEWRLEKIIHIKSNINSDGLCDDFKEMFEDLDPDCKSHSHIFEKIPELRQLYDGHDDYPERDDIIQFFYDNLKYQEGLFIQIAIQCPKYWSDNGWQAGWGYYQTHWLYVTDISEAEIFGHELSEKLHKVAKEEFLNKAA